MCQDSIPLHGQIVFYCIDIIYFISLPIRWWVFGLFLLLALLNHAGMNRWTYFYLNNTGICFLLLCMCVNVACVCLFAYMCGYVLCGMYVGGYVGCVYMWYVLVFVCVTCVVCGKYIRSGVSGMCMWQNFKGRYILQQKDDWSSKPVILLNKYTAFTFCCTVFIVLWWCEDPVRAGRPLYCICLRTERAPAMSGNPWGPNDEAELQFRWAGSGVEASEREQW